MKIVLTSRSKTVTVHDLRAVAAALQKQVDDDVGPIWTVGAEVGVLEDPDQVPRGVSPIIIMDTLPGSMKGVHTIEQDIPFAVVLAAHGWSLAASHEFVEMLVDPSGAKTCSGCKMDIKDGALQDVDGRVNYILEACDPVEDESHAYSIDGVTVSDFFTPNYFDDAADPNVRYSHSGKITRPRQLGPNGYLSWHDPATDELRQLRFFGALELRTLPSHPGAATQDQDPTLRGHVDRHTETPRIKRMRTRPLGRGLPR